MSFRALHTPTRLECAYYAGYFDSEGCVRVGRRHKHHWYARVTFQQNDPQVVVRLRTVYGGSFFSRGHKTMWQLDRFAALACFLSDIQPFVREKQSQIMAVLERFASAMSTATGLRLMRDLRRAKHRVCVKPTHVPQRIPPATCSRCTRYAVCRGLCGRHYQIDKRTGNLTTGSQRRPRQFAYRHIPSSEELAYISGYFDGDGNVDLILVNRTWHPRITFEQCCPDGVLLMHKTYGGSLRYCPAKKVTHRPSIRYVIAQQQAVMTFLNDVQPYIIEKRAEVELIRANFSDTSKHPQLRGALKHLRHKRPPPVGTIDAKTYIEVIAQRLTKQPNLLVAKSISLSKDSIGWRDNYYVYLVPDRARHLVEEMLQADNRSWNISSRLLHRALQLGEYLAPSKQTRPVIIVQINGGLRRVLKIPLTKFAAATVAART